MFSRILVPTDGSADAAAALERAIDLAERYGARVDVLHVVNTRSRYLYEPDLTFVDNYLDYCYQRGERVLERARTAVAARRVPVRTAIREGAPSREILEYATGNRIDLIVVGRHGRHRPGERLLGSVTDRVVRSSPAPVLTVRATDPGGE